MLRQGLSRNLECTALGTGPAIYLSPPSQLRDHGSRPPRPALHVPAGDLNSDPHAAERHQQSHLLSSPSNSPVQTSSTWILKQGKMHMIKSIDKDIYRHKRKTLKKLFSSDFSFVFNKNNSIFSRKKLLKRISMYGKRTMRTGYLSIDADTVHKI